MEWLKKLTALFFGLMVALAVAEWAVARFGAVDTPPGLYLPSQTRQFVHRPGFKGRDRYRNPIQINSMGLRDREVPLQKPDGVYRILVLGDSVAFADGLRAEDGFCHQLEQRLVSRGKNIQVLNAGVRGYNTRSEWEALRETGLLYEPDLVVVAYVLNDAEPVSKQQGLLKKAGFFYEIKQWIKQHFYLYSFFRRVLELARHRVTPGEFVENYDAQFGPTHPGWLDSVESLKGIRDLARENQVEVLVAVLPRLEGLGPGKVYPAETIQRQIVETSRSLGILTLDILPALKGFHEETLKIIPDDTFHPNRDGHGLIAQALEEFIWNSFLEPGLGAAKGKG